MNYYWNQWFQMRGLLLVWWVAQCGGLQQWQSVHLRQQPKRRFTFLLHDDIRTPSAFVRLTSRRGRAVLGQGILHTSESNDRDQPADVQSDIPLELDRNNEDVASIDTSIDSCRDASSVEFDSGIWDEAVFEEPPREIPKSISKHLTMPPLRRDRALADDGGMDTFWAQLPIACSLDMCAEGVNCSRLDQRFASTKLAVEAMTTLHGGHRKDQPLWAMCGFQSWLWVSGRLTWPTQASSLSPPSWWDLLSYRLAQDVLLGGASANVPSSLPPVVSPPQLPSPQEVLKQDEEGSGSPLSAQQAWQAVWAYDSMESRVALVRHGCLNLYSRSQLQALCWAAVAASLKPLLDGSDAVASAAYANLPSEHERAAAGGVARMVHLCQAASVSGSWQLLTTFSTDLHNQEKEEPSSPSPPPLAYVLALLGCAPPWLIKLTATCLRFTSSFHRVRDEIPSAALNIARKAYGADDARSSARSAPSSSSSSLSSPAKQRKHLQNHPRLLSSCALLGRLCAWCLSPRRWFYMWKSLAEHKPPVAYRFAPGSAEMMAVSDRRALASWLPR